MSRVLVEPDGSHEGLAGHDGARGGHQHAQQVELLGRQVQLAVALERAVRRDVDPDVLRLQVVLVDGVAVRAPQQRPHSREQLGEAKRLGDVVVRTGVEPDDEVDLVRAGRQDQHRRGQALVPDRPGDVEAVHVRQPEVQHDEVRAWGMVDRALTSSLHDYVIAFTAQGSGQRLGNRGVVFCQQYLGHFAMLGHATPISPNNRPERP
jgi:hypothetical protein